MNTILIPALLIGGLAAVFGIILAYASKKFFVEVDPKIDEIVSILPSANCGGCAFPGCAGYADAIVQNGAAVNLCAPGGEEVAKKIAAIMGVSLTPKERDIAVIHCQSGGYNNTAFKFEYKGINSCRSAATIAGGPNQCIWGCVFQYDCVKACQFDALHITEDGMKVVNEDNCTGCGACVKACPRSLIELVPISKRVHILCSSRDKGPIAKKSCGNNTACIACGLCVKNCPTQAITIVNNLAIIDYSKCINCGICASVCPTKAIEDRMLPRKEAFIHEDQCIGCTICAKKCPVQAISGELKHPHKVDPKLCVGCEVCVKACPKNAIEMVEKGSTVALAKEN
ncbi:MAG TPA: RnfABCDGE type electron transport complex subunit B [Candidatus Cloacimonadota bacterium]|nr:RnfABCDGE type electron transport complex subunit B [Candidatus Cloacimonadota bacterium]HPK40172.1 RnfABCDGE type electron transport complex subunit B [Candidatus Cloacimonadota bacterium]